MVARALRIDSTTSMASADEPHGAGIEVGDGAVLRLQGSRLAGNHLAGILAMGPAPTVIRAVGVIVANTNVEPWSKSYGSGAMALNGAKLLELLASRIEANHSAGVVGNIAGVRVRSTAIIDTRFASYTPLDASGRAKGPQISLADGIVGHNAAPFEIRNSLVAGPSDAGRAGLLLSGNTTGHVSGTFVTGSLYGLVTQGDVEVDTGGNLLWGNETNRIGDGGLYVPPPPKLSDLSSMDP